MGSWTKRSFPSRVLRLALVSSAILLGGLVIAGAPALAAEGSPPLIGPVTRGGQPTGEGIIETQIDPEGHETTYKISADCEVLALCQHTEGTLPADNEEHAVTLELGGLKGGVTYHFDIVAASSAGEADWPGEFTVPEVPPGACPDGCSSSKQYESEVPGWYNNLSNEESAKTVKEYEAKHAKELEAQHAKEHEEQESKEAVARAAEATERKQHEEQEQDKGGLSLAATSVTVGRDGTALVKLTCLGISSCHGKLTLTASDPTKAKGAKGGKNARTVSIGTVGFSITGDETKTVEVSLDAAGRTLLSVDHGRCSASLALRELAPSPQNTQTKTVQLVQQKAHGKARKPGRS